MAKWFIYVFRDNGKDETKEFTNHTEAADFFYTVSAEKGVFDLYVDGIDATGRTIYDCSDTLR